MFSAVEAPPSSFPALLRRSFTFFLGALVILVTGFQLVFGHSLYQSGKTSAASQAAALEQYVRRSLEVSAIVAHDVLDYLSRRGGLEGLEDDIEAHAFLANLARNTNLREGMVVVDNSGKVVLHSDRFPATPVDLSDRDWFKAHLQGADRVLDGSFLSRVTGTLLFVQTFAFRDPEGALLGAVNIGIPSVALLGAQALPFEGREVVMMVKSESGAILARDPFPEALIGQRLPVPDIPEGSAGLERRATDGHYAITGYSRLADVGLIASVSLPLTLILEPVMISASVSIPLLLLIVLGAMMSFRRLDIQQQTLLRSNARLETVLQASSLGAWQWCPKTDESHYMGRWAEMLGYSPQDLEPTSETWKRLLHPDEKDQILEDLQRVLRGEQDHFRHEHRLKHKDGRWVWVLDSGRVVEWDAAGEPEVVFGIHLDISERRDAEERMRAISLEVDHRSKNLLAVVQALVSLTRMDSEGSFKTILRGRIQALSRAHQLLSRSRWKGADLKVIAQEELAAYAGAKTSRIEIEGPKAVLEPSALQALAMALHELATNAAKHGALSTRDGKLSLTWSIPATGPSFTLAWIETMPPKTEGTSVSGVIRGFGSRLISMMIEDQLGGTLETRLTETGLVCMVTLPKALLVASETSDDEPAPRPDEDPGRPQPGARGRILLVEDDALIAADMTARLEEAGHAVVAWASDVAQGTTLARDGHFDAAVLDLNLRGDPSFPVADILTERRIPFVILTGYQRQAIPDRLKGIHLLQKPCPTGELERAIEALIPQRLGQASA
jgi:PAS domain S-box-containing protein